MSQVNKRAIILKLIRYFQQEEGSDPTYLDIHCESGLRPEVISTILREHEVSGDLRVERRTGCRNHYIIQEANHDNVQDQPARQSE